MRGIFVALKSGLFFFLVISLIHTESAYLNAEKTEMISRDPHNDLNIKLPAIFIKNEGQINEQVKYYEWISSTLFLQEGVFFSLYEGKNKAQVKLNFINSGKESEILGENRLDGKVSYFIGNNDSAWKRNIPAYRALLYKNIYRNIDMQFHAGNGQVYYHIIVKPGADLSDIKFSFDAVDLLNVNDKGLLTIEVQGKKFMLKKPFFYQDIRGKRVKISGDFHLFDKKTCGFQTAKYDRKQPLNINQVLIDTTYFGRKFKEMIRKRTSDNSGNTYITGGTAPDSLFWKGSLSIQECLEDAIVMKLHTIYNSLIYLIYIGGSSRDWGVSISADNSGNIYLTGDTSSKDFPIRNAFQRNYEGGGTDVFITKINASGDDLVYSTYLGGSNHDNAADIAIDNESNAYVTGTTKSINFPTQNSLQPQSGGYYDAFVAKINESGKALIYSTYLGGNSWDAGFHIKTDDEGNAFIEGCTKSVNFPLKNPLHADYSGGQDAFAVKINLSGNDLIYSTYLGSSGKDCRSDKAMDLFENLYFK
jgi:hypothetical protein